jgi:hypothetical protein
MEASDSFATVGKASILKGGVELAISGSLPCNTEAELK